MELQPTLSNEYVTIRPLKTVDFDNLYAVASDKLIWEQHPNQDRYKKEVFQSFFEKAMDSKGAFVIIDSPSAKIIGSSRYYNWDATQKTVVIGFTFMARNFWGTNYNYAIKKLMLDHAFQFVNAVHFHVAKTNFRSQKAMEKLGGKIIDYSTSEAGIEVNPIYEITKENWFKN